MVVVGVAPAAAGAASATAAVASKALTVAASGAAQTAVKQPLSATTQSLIQGVASFEFFHGHKSLSEVVSLALLEPHASFKLFSYEDLWSWVLFTAVFFALVIFDNAYFFSIFVEYFETLPSSQTRRVW